MIGVLMVTVVELGCGDGKAASKNTLYLSHFQAKEDRFSTGYVDASSGADGDVACDGYHKYMALENQLLSVSLSICLGKHDCVERIPSGNNLHTTLPPNMVDPLLRKKKEIESWLEDSRIIDSLDGQHYNSIMNKGLESKHKPSNPSKSSNFVGRVRGLKVFVGNFTYECNFMILKDTTSIIDHQLGEVVFGKPFARNTGLIYDQEEGTVTFEKDNEKIIFKMPHIMEAFNCIDFKDINTDSIPPFVLGSNDDCGKTYYSDSLTLGPEYKEDESISKEIRHLIKLKRGTKRHKGEVMLYLMRRSLEVLRKFHGMILGGRFN
nr:protein kinase-like domain, concanavalin A-like lectin/glucanase domain protein [Tanacetum cinerariifolium]